MADARRFLVTDPRQQISLIYTARRYDELQKLGADLPEKQIIPVKMLEPTPAVAMLQQHSGISTADYEQALQELVDLVGGLPLSLAVMGSYLWEQAKGNPAQLPNLIQTLLATPVRFRQEVRESDLRYRNIRGGWLGRLFPWRGPPTLTSDYIIGLSYQALTPAQQRLFCQVAAFAPDPLSFDTLSASAIARQSVELVAETLGACVGARLLEPAGAERFRMHREIQQWARVAHRAAVTAARQRVKDWHYALTRPAAAERFAAWRVHPDNWKQMLHTWQETVHLAEDLALDTQDPAAQTEARSLDLMAIERYLTTIVHFLLVQGYGNAVEPGLHQVLHSLTKVLYTPRLNDEALKQRLRLNRGWTRYYLGDIAYDRANYDQAEQHAGEALNDFQATQTVWAQAPAYVLLGQIAYALADYPRARQDYTTARTLIPETDERGTAAVLPALGRVAHAEGQSAQARTYFSQALAIEEQVLGPQHPATATTLHELGRVAQEEGQSAQARTYFSQALAIREAVFGPDHPFTRAVREKLAALAAEADDTGE